MSDGTKIAWTEATWNPIRARRRDGQPNKAGGGWICQRVSAGCQNCYAAGINKRLGTGFDYDARGVAASDIYLDERILTQPLHWRKPRRIFVCSMTDLFGEWVPDEWIDRVFAVMALSKPHAFQVLTKRPKRMREYLSTARERIAAVIRDEKMTTSQLYELDMAGSVEGLPGTVHGLWWPLPNVWLGVSAEDQRAADERIPELLATPAAVRWLSCEPLLEHVDLRLDEEALCGPGPDDSRRTRTGLRWVVVGGESGSGARPTDIDWIRGIVQQCQGARVPVFVKQLGARPVGLPPPESWRGLARPDGRLRDRAGGDPVEWPASLRVRQFPEVGR